MEHDNYTDDYTDDYTFFESPPIHKQREEMGVKEAALKDIILPYLPAKSLIRFSAVTKEWCKGIKHPFMSFKQGFHFKKLSGFFCQVGELVPQFVSLNDRAYGVPIPDLGFLPEPVDILSSCGGLLVCHGRGNDELYYVCNPATTEWTPLPKPQLYHGFGSKLVLAYELSAMNIEGDYELICAVPMFDDHLYFEVYSSRTKLWKILNTTLVDMQDLAIKHNSFYMNGVAYWITNTKNVIAFVLEKEVYEVIPLPTEIQDCPDGVLTQLGGELCYITMSHLSGNTFYIMINGGIDMTLKHRLQVNIGEEAIYPQYQVLPSLDGEKVMIQVGYCIYSYSILDQILELVTRVEIGPASTRNKYLAYVNSLVQLP